MAAGIGKRMGDLTKDAPKCLLNIGGKPLIFSLLESFYQARIDEVVIVVGHKKEMVKKALGKSYKGMRIIYCNNPKYATANNIYSIWSARNVIKGAFIQCHGDLVVHPGLLKEVAQSEVEDGVVVDPDPSHFVADGNRTILRNGRVIDINKQAQASESAGRAFGIYRFSAPAAKKYFELAENFLEDAGTFEDPLRLLFRERKFGTIGISHPYAEIDDPEDIEKAEAVAQRIDKEAKSAGRGNSFSLMRDHALKILKAGINAVMPEQAMKKIMRYESGLLYVGKKVYPVKGKIIVIGAGKAAGKMALALEAILPPENMLGAVNAHESEQTKRVIVTQAAHPLPDEQGIKGVRKMLALLNGLTRDDLVICVVSGGGSALLPDPAQGITLEDLRKMTQMMLLCGAETYELQYVRKHCSTLKGGQLAMHCLPAKVISLILSDVVNQKDVCAAGPTDPDASTFKDALGVLKKYGLLKKAPKSISEHLRKGDAGKIPETPKPGDPRFRNVENVVIADYRTALDAMAVQARLLGYAPNIRKDPLLGESQIAAKMLEKDLSKIRSGQSSVFCSETTIKVSGKGKGGRNQEIIARLIPFLIKNLGVLASVDSDGRDFLDGVAGAIADSESAKKADKIAPYLKTSNTYALHKKLGGLIEWKPSGTNVGDLGVFLRR